MKKKIIVVLMLAFVLIFQSVFSYAENSTEISDTETYKMQEAEINSIESPPVCSTYAAPSSVQVKILTPYLVAFGGTGLTYKYIADVSSKETVAYCLDSDKKPPLRENVAQSLSMSNSIAHNMYFCYGYQGQEILKSWLNKNGYSAHTTPDAFYALSHVLLAYTNNPAGAFWGWDQINQIPAGRIDKDYQDMIVKTYNYVKSLPIPTSKEDVSFTTADASWSNTQFRSENITFQGDATNYVNYSVPSDMSLHMDGKTYQGGTSVKINGGKKFYLTTSNVNRSNTTYTSPKLTAALAGYVPYRGPGTATQQAVSFFAATETKTASFKVEFGLAKGKLKLKKVAASEEKLVSLCPQQYSLEGAEYGVYSDASCTKKVGTLKTTAQKKGTDGKLYAESNELELDFNTGEKEKTLYVKETKAPKGYILNQKVYQCKASVGKTASVTVDEKPYFDPMTITLEKQIPNGKTEFQKYLEGAEYTVRYYPDILNTESEVKAKKPLRTWVFRTNANGEVRIRESWKVGGDELFKNDKGTVVGLIGTYTVEETKAPSGFVKNSGIEIRHIKKGVEPPDINGTNAPVMSELPDNNINRKITVTKKIAEKDYYEPFGTPTAVFELTGKDVFGKTYKFRKSITLSKSTLKDGYYTGSVVFSNLPAGEYTVREIGALRYKFKSISSTSSNGVVSGQKVNFELVNTLTGSTTYQNEIKRWNKTSHSTCVVNKL